MLRIEDLEELLLLFDGELQVCGDRIGQLRGLVRANAGGHGLVVQRLLQLHVLLKQRVNPLHQLLDLRGQLQLRLAGAHGRDKEAVDVVHLDRSRALHTLNQHLDIAVRHLDALDDIADGAGRVDIVGVRLVDGGVMLRRQEDLPVAGERLFESPHTRFAADDKRRHHVGEDDHVADGHHRKLSNAAAQRFFRLDLSSLSPIRRSNRRNDASVSGFR